jgi:hypothetical protein
MVVSSKDPPGELLRPWGCCPAGAYVTRRSCLVVARGAGRGHGMDGRHPGHHVRLIAVAHGRMVVLVLVGGGQVGSLLAVVEVVGHVGVLLAMAASCARRPGSRNLLPKVRCDTGFRFRPVADALRRFGSPRPGTGLAGRAGRLQSRHSSPLSALYPALFPGIARATCAAEYPEGRCEPLGSHAVWINVEPASQPRAVVR